MVDGACHCGATDELSAAAATQANKTPNPIILGLRLPSGRLDLDLVLRPVQLHLPVRAPVPASTPNFPSLSCPTSRSQKVAPFLTAPAASASSPTETRSSPSPTKLLLGSASSIHLPLTAPGLHPEIHHKQQHSSYRIYPSRQTPGSTVSIQTRPVDQSCLVTSCRLRWRIEGISTSAQIPQLATHTIPFIPFRTS